MPNEFYSIHINIHINQRCTGIEPILLPTAPGLKQSVLTIQPRRHTFNQNDEKYVDRRSIFDTTGIKITNEPKKKNNLTQV